MPSLYIVQFVCMKLVRVYSFGGLLVPTTMLTKLCKVTEKNKRTCDFVGNKIQVESDIRSVIQKLLSFTNVLSSQLVYVLHVEYGSHAYVSAV